MPNESFLFSTGIVFAFAASSLSGFATPRVSRPKPSNPFRIEILQPACIGAEGGADVRFRVLVNAPVDAMRRISIRQARLSLVAEPVVRLESADLGGDKVLQPLAASEATPSLVIPEDETVYVDRTLLRGSVDDIAGNVFTARLRRTGTVWGRRIALELEVDGMGRIFAWVPLCSGREPGVLLRSNEPVASHEVASSSVSALATVDITWTVSYTDDGGNSRPLRYATAQLWDFDDLSPNDLLWSGSTDANGKITASGLSNSDESGGLDVFLVIVASGPALSVGDDSGSTYKWTTQQFDNITDGAHSYDSTISVANNSGACHIYDTVTYGYQYVEMFSSAPLPATVKWPCASCGSSTSGSEILIEGGSVNTADPDEWDESVILHEYGHVLDNQYTGGFTPDYGGDGHSWDSHENPATAWSEGWGNFFQSPVRCSAGYSSCDHYLDSNSFGGWDLNLETGFDDAGTGSTDVEGAVTTALWDIYDASDDSGDTMSAGFAPIWTVFDAGTGGDTIGIFWREWSARGLGDLSKLADIFWQHGVYDAVTDDSAPAVIITNPTSNSSSSSPVSLGGTASDNLAVTRVECSNAANATTVTAAGTNNWSCSMGLVPGTNIFKVRAYDRKENSGTGTITITYSALDLTAPTAAIISPTSEARYSTSSTTITLAGNASDDVGVTEVTCSNRTTGITAPASGTSNWSCSVALVPGDNSITVTARDAAGNQGSDSITVTPGHRRRPVVQP